MNRIVRGWWLSFGLLLATGGADAARGRMQVLYSFCGDARTCCPDTAGCVTGDDPVDLVVGRDGAYYGTAGSIVYRMDPDTRAVSVLHRFDGEREGVPAYMTLAAGSDGNLYGALEGGPGGSGSLYRLSLSGKFSVVYAFGTDVIGDAFGPMAEDRQGNWYLSTVDGNAWDGGPGGAIYRISRTPGTSSAIARTLHVFNDPIQVANGLVFAADGRLYGTTRVFRQEDGERGNGIVYRITSDGVFTVLHVFDGGSNGKGKPYAALTVGRDRALYGIAGEMIFRVDLSGRFNVLSTNAGPAPSSPLVQFTDGNLYGAAMTSHRCLIIRLSRKGDYRVLMEYPRTIEPNNCGQLMTRGSDNALYGTMLDSGPSRNGSIFRYVPPPLE